MNPTTFLLLIVGIVGTIAGFFTERLRAGMTSPAREGTLFGVFVFLTIGGAIAGLIAAAIAGAVSAASFAAFITGTFDNGLLILIGALGAAASVGIGCLIGRITG